MKKIFITSLLLFLTFNVTAQRKERKERIQALKIAFITERLELTETEAQKFWPIYNAFDEEEDKLRHDSHALRKETRIEELSESDAKVILDKIITTENKKAELRKKYITNLQKVLPAKKIILLKITEDAFNRRMLEEIKKRKENFKKQ